MIKSLYTKYTQKSRIFLYPFLDIKRGVSVTPIETYISWTGLSKPEDKNLICVYYLRDDTEFKLFEKHKLLTNKHFVSFYELPDQKAAYIFNLESETESFNCFLKGTYSKIPEQHKKKILAFFYGNKHNYSIINSYLNPENYFDIYAEHLNVDVKILKDVGELCSPPDFVRENLTSDIKQIEFLDYI
jgi:urate oxidase